MTELPKTTRGITILGLGPGDPDLLTLQAWHCLEQAGEVYLRTREHPVVAGFPAGLAVYSFDDLYEQGNTFEEVYEEIIQRIITLGQRPQGVVYAVPGHPFVAETTGPEISKRAKDLGIPVRVIEGISFLEPTFTALGLDPFPRMVLVDALELAARHTPSFAPNTPALVTQIYNRMVASSVKLTLNAVFPDEHPVRLVHGAGTPLEEVEDLCLYEIDRSPKIGLLTALYVPPLAEDTSLESFQEVIARLRAPDGCPWDREQTHLSLRKYLLEETYEALAALDAEDPESTCEELGDLLLQIVLHAQIAVEDGEFTLADVLQRVNRKIVRRHPHVFGDVQLADSAGVLRNWQKLKEEERKANGETHLKGLLDGVPVALPSLSQAQEIQDRAARVGFDWSEIGPVIEKVREELTEVLEAADGPEREKELGDLLFAAVNLVRWYKVDAESVLRATNLRFRRRFAFIEAQARKDGRDLTSMTLAEMDQYWEQAKDQEA